VGGELHAHDRFGTARVNVAGHSYDFAMARTERYAHPGALPDVEPARRLEDDLGRRDFTVNAIALAVAEPGAGLLVAEPRALGDLEHRRLRVLHDASFEDDPTRLFRLARYAARLGFEVEERTAGLAGAAVAGGALRTVSGPRLGQELRLAAREADPVAAFARLADLGLTRALDPPLGLDAETASQALAALPADGRRDLVVLALAAREVPEEEIPAALGGLGFERDELRPAMALGARLPALASALRDAAKPSEIDALLAGSTAEEAALTAALGPVAPVRLWLEELRDVALEIDGADLRDAGAPEGPRIGAALAAARAGRLDGDLMSREAQLAAALRIAGR
jgi:tRNA nucleotidyltransferase (CCA-adding enzyme)